MDGVATMYNGASSPTSDGTLQYVIATTAYPSLKGNLTTPSEGENLKLSLGNLFALLDLDSLHLFTWKTTFGAVMVKVQKMSIRNTISDEQQSTYFLTYESSGRHPIFEGIKAK